MLQFFQVTLVTTDLPGSLRLYAEAFRFRNAGGQCSWGSKIQGLGSDARHLMWWLVGQQKFFQLEFFQYTRPMPRSLPSDWHPADHGWTRFGVLVADFDACMNGLKSNGVDLLAPAVVKDGRRRVAIRDPYVGVIIEIMESNPQQPEGPIVSYVTSSVSDLESARTFYRDVLQFEILPLENLHVPSDEALWCLPGANRDGFLVGVGGAYLEIVHYRKPEGRDKPRDYRLSDQGIMNVSLGSRRAEPVARALERLKEAGYVPPYTFENGENICGYIIDPERAFEFASIPEELDAAYGFVAAPLGFMGKHVK